MPSLSEVFNLDPDVERLTLLPRLRGSLPSEKSVMMPDRYMPDIIAPQFIYDIVRAVKAPARAARGETLGEEEALNVALNVMGGGLATSGSAPAKSLGMFIGPKSAAWDKAAAAKALELEKAGKSAREIWQETMTVRGLDKKWRQEIPDVGAVLDINKIPQRRDMSQLMDDIVKERGLKLDPNRPIASQISSQEFDEIYRAALDRNLEQKRSVRLPYAFQHEKLEEAYPNLINNLQIERELRPEARGSFNPRTQTVAVGGSENIGMTEAEKLAQAKSTTLHEIQHAIQHLEDWGRGGHPDVAKAIAAAQIKADTAPLVEPFTRNRYYWDEYGKAARSEYMLRLSDIANRENIKPRTIYKLSDWYEFGDDYRRQAGPQPKKPGPDRDKWFQDAAEYIRTRRFSRDHRYQDLPFDNIRDAKNAQKRAMTQIKKTDEAAQQYQELGEKQRRFAELSDVEAYKRLAGEAESRLTQAREPLSMEERRANFPFAEQYERTLWQGGKPGTPEMMNPYGLDVPAKETVAYTQFGTSYKNPDPLHQFLGLTPTAPSVDPLLMFVGPLGK